MVKIGLRKLMRSQPATAVSTALLGELDASTRYRSKSGRGQTDTLNPCALSGYRVRSVQDCLT